MPPVVQPAPSVSSSIFDILTVPQKPEQRSPATLQERTIDAGDVKIVLPENVKIRRDTDPLTETELRAASIQAPGNWADIARDMGDKAAESKDVSSRFVAAVEGLPSSHGYMAWKKPVAPGATAATAIEGYRNDFDLAFRKTVDDRLNHMFSADLVSVAVQENPARSADADAEKLLVVYYGEEKAKRPIFVQNLKVDFVPNSGGRTALIHGAVASIDPEKLLEGLGGMSQRAKTFLDGKAPQVEHPTAANN